MTDYEDDLQYLIATGAIFEARSIYGQASAWLTVTPFSSNPLPIYFRPYP